MIMVCYTKLLLIYFAIKNNSNAAWPRALLTPEKISSTRFRSINCAFLRLVSNRNHCNLPRLFRCTDIQRALSRIMIRLLSSQQFFVFTCLFEEFCLRNTTLEIMFLVEKNESFVPIIYGL